MIAFGSSAEPPIVSTPPAEEFARRLAWLPRVLTFTDDPLPLILNEFGRHNSIVLRIDDRALQDLRLTARFRSDNVPGFLRLLESDYGVRVQHPASGEIVLQSAR
jgi:ferric-dicitrate binding protein FerR (iron transport regulator)